MLSPHATTEPTPDTKVDTYSNVTIMVMLPGNYRPVDGLPVSNILRHLDGIDPCFKLMSSGGSVAGSLLIRGRLIFQRPSHDYRYDQASKLSEDIAAALVSWDLSIDVRLTDKGEDWPEYSPYDRTPRRRIMRVQFRYIIEPEEVV